VSKFIIPKRVKLVRQQDDNSCSFACIAMVTGRDYEDVRKDFSPVALENGITIQQIIKHLAHHGFSVIFKTVEYYNQKDFARDEILKPFAPVHIVSITRFVDRNFDHVVVMDKKGKLYCPSGSTDEYVRSAYTINSVIGIYNE
jgi:hypothetical protein